MGFSPCGNCLQEHFLQDGPRQGLKPNLFQFFAARLKSCPDTKHGARVEVTAVSFL
jgi:hypothetical protein